MLGDDLYQLTPKEDQLTHLGWFCRNGIITGAGVGVRYARVQVPAGFTLRLGNVCAIYVPGAGETIADQGLELINPEGQSTAYELVRLPLGGQRSFDRQFDQVVIPSGWTVAAWGSFTPGAVSNEVRCRVQGILVPTGNLQLFNLEGLGF